MIRTRNRYGTLAGIMFLTGIFIWLLPFPLRAAAAAKTYTVKASSVPYQEQYIKSSTYNEKTRQYYMLRSYLEQLEKDGGGTLILSKGTYTITNTLYIPSGVTIVLRDGVKLKKGMDTGTAGLAPAKSMIQLIAPSKSAVKGAVGKYAGESGITIRGEGTASIDLDYTREAVGVLIGHNRDIRIQGITFRKMCEGSFIKLGASENIIIKDNVFRDYKAAGTGSAFAIAVEIPDAATKGLVLPWSKEDKTVCRKINIEGNTFSKLERGVGSLKYTENRYHTDITVQDNTFSEIASSAVRILNWKDCSVTNNCFTDLRNEEGNLKAVLISGAINPTVTNNEFIRTDRAIQIMPWKNTNNGKEYKVTYNTLSKANVADMKNNTLKEMGEYIIRYNKKYNEFTLDTERWEIFDPSITRFSVKPDSETFQKAFINYSTYNSATKQYYVLRSYLEQLERTGGGILTLEPGTYRICNTLYVPSHVTIVLKDGVTIMKTEETGAGELLSSKSIFQLAAPSKSKTEGAYGGYEGETDITFRGEGTAVIDLDFTLDAIGIVLCHNTKVEISGITFRNMYSGHFIELDASSDITIRQNRFLYHKPSSSGIKEAINLDTPDRKTGGFHAPWTKYDGTPDKDILITENIFENLERAIGTHKYTQGKYHENVQIINNKITNTSSDAIRVLNWASPVIKGNEIRMVAGGRGSDRAILISGLKSGGQKATMITENTFCDVPRPIQLMPWRNTKEGEEYETAYNEFTPEEMDLMLKNNLLRCGEVFIRVNRTYNVFDRDTSRYYYSYLYIKWESD